MQAGAKTWACEDRPRHIHTNKHMHKYKKEYPSYADAGLGIKDYTCSWLCKLTSYTQAPRLRGHTFSSAAEISGNEALSALRAGNKSSINDRNSGTSSATNLDMFMSRKHRIIRKTSDLQQNRPCNDTLLIYSAALQIIAHADILNSNIARCTLSGAASQRQLQLWAYLSGLARLAAPAVRSTERMLRRPKS